MKPIRLPADLEMAVISAMAAGAIGTDLVEDDELSAAGKALRNAIVFLAEERGKAGSHDLATLAQLAIQREGIDRDLINPWIKEALQHPSSRDITEVVEIVRTTHHLNHIADLIGDQLATKKFDRAAILQALDARPDGDKLVAAADLITDKLPPLPTGPDIPGLPGLSKITGGLFGMWAIGGEAGNGKTTLGLQIAVGMAETQPVLYYDLENGDESLIHRVGVSLGGDIEETRKALQRVYLRHNPRTIHRDLTTIGEPCVIVVDSLQKLPTQEKHKTASLEKWLRVLEELKEQGHSIVVLSEKNRDGYGKSEMGGYKGTGEVEYTADLGIQLQREKGDPFVQLHIVKNRHRPTLGYVYDLERENTWRFKERPITKEQPSERMETVGEGRSDTSFRKAFSGKSGGKNRFRRS